MSGIVKAGGIIEMHDRVFKISTCHYDNDGGLISISAECLTPKDEDEGKWWALRVVDESALRVHTLH
jgi:hypothetical protein